MLGKLKALNSKQSKKTELTTLLQNSITVGYKFSEVSVLKPLPCCPNYRGHKVHSNIK